MKIIEIGFESLDMKYEKLRARRPAAEKRLIASLGDQEQQSVVVVAPAPGDVGRYVVIDGHAQVRVLEKLKRDVVKAAVWELPPTDALIAVYQMKSGGGYSALEEGSLVYELVRVCGLGLGEVGRRLDRSKSWVCGRLGLIESLPEQVLDGVQKGTIGAYVATKFLLPFARANTADCERLAEKISRNDFKSREVELLCRHYGKAGRRVARSIVDDPERFLRVLEARKKGEQDLELSEAENRCAQQMELIGNVSSALARRLPEAVGYDTGEPARRKLRRSWQRCVERFGMFHKSAEAVFQRREARRTVAAVGRGEARMSERKEKIEEVVSHDRQRDADGGIRAAQEGP